MKEAYLLIFRKDIDFALKELRKLGLIHIKHLVKFLPDTIGDLEDELSMFDKTLGIVSDLKAFPLAAASLNCSSGQESVPVNSPSFNVPAGSTPKDKVYSFAEKLIYLFAKQNNLSANIQELEEKVFWFKRWGDFSLKSLEALKKTGVFIKLYEVPLLELNKILNERIAYVVCRKENKADIILICRDGQECLGYPEVKKPEQELSAITEKIIGFKQELSIIKGQLLQIARYKECFIEQRQEILKKIKFYNIKSGMVYKQGIYALKGFFPQESEQKISQIAQEQGWAAMVQDPKNSEEVPTLIRNSHWVELIRPVFKFMGVIPGYKEYDISFWFLLFFSLFFAMLIGDAGYGILFLAITFFLRRKFRKSPKEPFFLMYVLSSSTIVWGALTGTWFGFEKIAHLPFLNWLVIGKINSFAAGNQKFMINLCFLIGAVHLTIARGIRIFRYSNSLFALAQAGWVLIVWCAFFFAGKFALNRALPDFALILGGIGVVLVILFSNPQKNILKGIGLSLANLPLKAINSFADIISYLRLFAVGYATVAVATTFNDIALSVGFSGVISGLIAAAILFLGHTLNIILGLIAVIVHGVRLNLLEFSGNLDMEWSGISYDPFRE